MSAVNLQVNADGLPKPRFYADTGGRPPDGTLHISIPLTLERPASPSPLEGQSDAKKVRNDEDLNSVDAGDVMDMETELGDDVTVKQADLCAKRVLNPYSVSNRNDVMDGKARYGSSYASKVVNGAQMDTGALQGSRFAALASENNDEHVAAPPSGMKAMHEIVSNLKGDREVGKFTEQHTTNRNEAYMNSNPDKKSKASKLRINEEGHSGVNSEKKLLKGDGGARKGLKESTRKGIHVKKPSASRVSRSSVVEWVQSAYARVDILGQQVADGGNEKIVISTNEQTDMCASDEDDFGDTSYMENISDDVELLADGVEGSQ
ncbi:hypothetical protein V6N11_069809 [Hibiscus sabdariffa]|uniref:Uncharacterized protein n=1 Tax=Hibiscus sabdariffa TaxID=183260 RepID=A0ABR2Q496_9ROSI